MLVVIGREGRRGAMANNTLDSQIFLATGTRVPGCPDTRYNEHKGAGYLPQVQGSLDIPKMFGSHMPGYPMRGGTGAGDGRGAVVAGEGGQGRRWWRGFAGGLTEGG